MEGYGGEHRIIISREGAMDELLVQVEGKKEVYEKKETPTLHQEAVSQLQQVLGIRTRVEIVPLNTIPRTDFKARRVIDNRDVFREMNQRLDEP